jgi:hypothetical protein
MVFGTFLANLIASKKVMKKYLLVAVAFVLFAFKQTDDAIVNSLKSANSEQVAGYFDSFIELKLPEKDEVKNMGKNQASIAFNSFFKENGVKSFELTSKREMGETMQITGKLQNAGKGYGITIRLKKQGDKLSITNVRIN